MLNNEDDFKVPNKDFILENHLPNLRRWDIIMAQG